MDSTAMTRTLPGHAVHFCVDQKQRCAKIESKHLLIPSSGLSQNLAVALIASSSSRK
jgi:hypothetical protein